MRLLFLALGRCPLLVLQTLGAMLGWLMSVVPNRRLLRSQSNIALCLPQLGADEQQRLARKAMINLGRTALETPRMWFGPEQTVRGLIQLGSGAELLQTARDKGTGVILLTPHLNWEVAVLFTTLQGHSTILQAPQKSIVEEIIDEGRGRFGAAFVQAVPGGVTRQFLADLADQRMVLLLPDQDPPGGRGVFAPFFGVAAHTPTLVSRLAHSSGAPVLFLRTTRLPRGRGFAVDILPAPPGIHSADKQLSATAMNLGLQTCIEGALAQYMWNVRRFRTRPEGEPAMPGYY